MGNDAAVPSFEGFEEAQKEQKEQEERAKRYRAIELAVDAHRDQGLFTADVLIQYAIRLLDYIESGE